MMFRMPGLSSLMLDAMRVCLEHHMNFDITGYPDVEHEWAQATMTRIVALADCFDAMTAHRTYHRRPRTSFEGLQYLLGPVRVQFDPAVLWSLVRTVGLYPAGSMLLTQTNHVVLAVSPNPADLRRPFCRVLVRPDGITLPEDVEETWDPMPQSDSVVRVVHRGPYFIERHSDAGTLVGFIGGLVVGSILSSTPPPAPPPPAYEYYDPYCHRHFVTVEAYDEHLCYHRHPRSVEVIEVHSGRCVDTMDWRDGRWCSRNDRPRHEEWTE